MIESIVQWLVHMVDTIGYGGVALAMFIESFFAPIPSELIMPFAGFSASEGNMSLWLVIVVGGIASYLGTLPFYFIGYRGHRARVNQFVSKYGKYLFITAQEVEKGYDLFKKYGYAFIFFGRLVPIVRTFVSFPAGSVRMPFVKFSILTIVGSTARSAVLAVAGYVLGKQWETVGAFFKQYEHVVLGIAILCIVAFLAYKAWSWRIKYLARKKK